MCSTIDGSDEELSSILGIELQATQTNSKRGEMFELLKIGLCRGISSLYKVPSVFNVYVFVLKTS